MSLKPETIFRQKVIRDLLTLPTTAIFSIQQRTIKGDPDLILCMKGHFVALELKSLKGKASKLQEYKLEKIRLAGGQAYVVSPYTWGEIFNQLKALSGGFVL